MFYDRLNELQVLIGKMESEIFSKKDMKDTMIARKSESDQVIQLPASDKAQRLAKISAKISEGAKKAWASRSPEARAAILAKRAETRAKRAALAQPQPEVTS